MTKIKEDKFPGTISKDRMMMAKQRKHESQIRTLSEEEIKAMNEDLLASMSATRAFHVKKKTEMARLSAEGKELDEKVDKLHATLSTGYIEEEGDYYYFPDMENSLMHIYWCDPATGQGRLTRSRPLSRTEMQVDLHSMALEMNNENGEDDDIEDVDVEDDDQEEEDNNR